MKQRSDLARVLEPGVGRTPRGIGGSPFNLEVQYGIRLKEFRIG